jgi:hypothetical protein
MVNASLPLFSWPEPEGILISNYVINFIVQKIQATRDCIIFIRNVNNPEDNGVSIVIPFFIIRHRSGPVYKFSSKSTIVQPTDLPKGGIMDSEVNFLLDGAVSSYDKFFLGAARIKIKSAGFYLVNACIKWVSANA